MTLEASQSRIGADYDDRPALQAVLRGAKLVCPSCATGPMFASYLKTVATCSHCGEELHHHRADDAPPYFTIVIVGHIVVWLVLATEIALQPPLWLHAAIWLPLTVALALAFLPPVKGAIVGLQWALRMHGFDPAHRDIDPHDGTGA